MVATKKDRDPYPGMTVRDVYFKHLKTVKRGGSLFTKENKPIQVDLTTERAEAGCCLSCGKPRSAEDMSGSQCMKCGIKQLIEVYGYSKEDAQKEHLYRQERKEARPF